MGLNPLIGLYPVKQCWVINSSSFTTKVESFRSSVTFVGKSLVRIKFVSDGGHGWPFPFSLFHRLNIYYLVKWEARPNKGRLSTKLLEKPHPASRPAGCHVVFTYVRLIIHVEDGLFQVTLVVYAVHIEIVFLWMARIIDFISS